MQYENKAKMAAIFNLDVIASFIILIGMLIRYRTFILGYLADSTGTGIDRYAYFMVAMTFVSLLILFISSIAHENNLFIWLAVLFVLGGFVSTVMSGMYPVARLPFRFVNMFYWVAVMILSYYSVLHFGTPKFHIAVVALALLFLSYTFFTIRSAEEAYSDMLLLNPVYFIAYLMPVVLLLRSMILKASGLLLIFVIIVLSYKRMAIMAYLSSVLVYFYYLSLSDSKAKFSRIATVSLGAIMFIGVMAFSFRYMGAAFGLDWGTRMSDIAEGGGRLDVWKGAIAAFTGQPAYWLFGHGYLATQFASASLAHNDFLEILYDYGLVGLILYVIFIVKIVSIFFEMKRLKYTHFAAYAVSLVWFAWGTMFSMLVMHPYWFLSLALFWGITIADFENAKRQSYISETEDPLYEYQYYDDEAADVPAE